MSEESRWYNWPAEWFFERAFWREVATRTLAGILTLLIIGGPGVLYAMSVGALTPDQGVPIVIGVGIAFALILLYIAVLAIIRWRERRAIEQSLRTYGKPDGTRQNIDDFMAYIDGPTIDWDLLTASLKASVQESQRKAARRRAIANAVTVLIIILGMILAFISITTSFLDVLGG